MQMKAKGESKAAICKKRITIVFLYSRSFTHKNYRYVSALGAFKLKRGGYIRVFAPGFLSRGYIPDGRK